VDPLGRGHERQARAVIGQRSGACEADPGGAAGTGDEGDTTGERPAGGGRGP
jgi:hypothetical protein